MTVYYIAALSSTILTAIAQILLKMGANKNRDKSIMHLYLNPWTIIGYILFVIVTLFTLFALQKMNLKEMVFILALSYLMVPLFSKLILKEHISKKRLKGIAIIFCGITIYNLDKLL